MQYYVMVVRTLYVAWYYYVRIFWMNIVLDRLFAAGQQESVLWKLTLVWFTRKGC